MKGRFIFSEREVAVDLSRPIDISIPLDFHGAQPRAFFLPEARARAFEAGAFIGDVRRGGSANCETVELCPHGNGTHTECVGHITAQRLYVGELLEDAFVLARLVTVDLVSLEESEESYGTEGAKTDQVICRRRLEEVLEGAEPTTALIIRTRPNTEEKRARDHSGNAPAYLTHEAMTFIRARGVVHLLVDVPSVDREEDGGSLANHHGFWEFEGGEPSSQARRRTITEMIYADDVISDGLYVLNLQIPHFLLDAAPSRPLLFALDSTTPHST